MKDKMLEDFDEMITEMCGDVIKDSEKTNYKDEMIFFRDQFYKFNKSEQERKEKELIYYHTHITCPCGEKYKFYTEPLPLLYDLYEDPTPMAEVQEQKFYCWKCGRPFRIVGGKIVKIVSKLEVVL